MRLPLSSIPWLVSLVPGHRGLVPEVEGGDGTEEPEDSEDQEEHRTRAERLVDQVADEGEEDRADHEAQRLAEPVVGSTASRGLGPFTPELQPRYSPTVPPCVPWEMAP